MYDTLLFYFSFMNDILRSDAESVIKIEADPITGVLCVTRVSVLEILEYLAEEGIRIPITRI